MPTGLDIVFRARDETGRAVRSVNRELNKTGAETSKLNTALQVAGPALIGLGGAAVAGIATLVSQTVSASKEIDNLARSSGLGAEGIQIFGRIAEESGGDMEDVADAAREMQLRLTEAANLGSGPAVDALRLLGVTLEELEGMNPAEQFALLRDRLSEVEDPARRAFLAEELLGGSSERLFEVVSRSSEAFKAQADAIRESGSVISDDGVASAVAFSESMGRLTDITKGLGVTLAEGLLPALETTFSGIEVLVGAYRDAQIASEELEERNERVGRAMEFATERTIGLSFGAVALKGEFVDLDEVVEELAQEITAAGSVAVGFGNAVVVTTEATGELTETVGELTETVGESEPNWISVNERFGFTKDTVVDLTGATDFLRGRMGPLGAAAGDLRSRFGELAAEATSTATAVSRAADSAVRSAERIGTALQQARRNIARGTGRTYSYATSTAVPLSNPSDLGTGVDTGIPSDLGVGGGVQTVNLNLDGKQIAEFVVGEVNDGIATGTINVEGG